ncbi:hypothetical protein [Tsukamurella tyrosinosolvens]|uniref:hypothetical protein n=1 Tax=Tsukamurella tyrosinosolvens TaxID=57704 RepID=UPI0011C07F0A|nr:hypothetical protein [Tsukamurella tyrosinosolvens]
MKRAIVGIGACAGLLTAGAVLTAAPAGADCAVGARDDCAAQRDATRTETVTVTRTKTTTSTTTSTTTRTTTVTVTATRTRTAALAVARGAHDPASGPVVAERPE